MKLLLVSVCLFATATCAPVDDTQTQSMAALRALPALDHEEIHDKFGQFALRYVTAEGIVVSEQGRLIPNGDGTGYVMVMEGEFSYIGDDGKRYTTKYTSGIDGYHAVGNHLPVAPEPIEEEQLHIAPENVEIPDAPVFPEAVEIPEAPVIPEGLEIPEAPVVPEEMPVDPFVPEQIIDAADSFAPENANRRDAFGFGAPKIEVVEIPVRR